MAISDAIKAKLNKMNRAAQDAVLGDFVQDTQDSLAEMAHGTHTVTAAEVTATKVEINTGITIGGGIVSVTRSNIQLGSAKITYTTTVLKVESNSSTYVLTAGDIINYIVFE